MSAVGRKYVHIQANLLSIEPIEGIIETAVQAFGHVDILVNNAGIITRNDSVDFTEKEWDDVMNINVKSVFFMCQAVARQFIKQGKGGKIINVASMLSFQGRHSRAVVHGLQERCEGHHHADGQRVGQARHQC